MIRFCSYSHKQSCLLSEFTRRGGAFLELKSAGEVFQISWKVKREENQWKGKLKKEKSEEKREEGKKEKKRKRELKKGEGIKK